MTNKILDIIFTEKSQRFRFTKELRTIRKVISKFYENIRNPKKKDPMYVLSNTIKLYMEDGQIGKFPLDQFSLTEIGEQRVELQTPGERIKEEDGKLGEVSF